ncbi:NAD(P)-dependent alcohol dehydrogenase [Bradyrhizobium sp. INPA03-11B]|uniref:NAD(P)-dependent alcohol dehydrogenase n=1 Tax=Bradyrhizobium sp. INPA03-11B TaxID=418598 RepID=UPI00338D7321
MRAAVIRTPGADFMIESVELDEPRADEMVVRIAGVGLCHTDLFAREGNIMPLPAVFGHEGAGIVERVGADVRKVEPGDHVIISFRSCGHCPSCRSGLPSYCRWMPALNYMGSRTDGSATIRAQGVAVAANFFGQSSFATHALTSERNVVKVARDLPLATLAPLGCGVQTGAGAVMRALNCPNGSSLLVCGGGTVGLSAVMAAVVQGCSTVVVVEPHAARRALALELGATHVLDPVEVSDLPSAVHAVIGVGVDFALDTTGRKDVLHESLACLAPHGTLGLLGVAAHGAAIAGEINQLITYGRSIRGINIGDVDPDTFLPELLALHHDGRFPFDRLIRTYPFSAINEAVSDQHDGRCIKAVLLMDPA